VPRPKYTSEAARPRASRQFTDREELIGAVERVASDLPLREHKVLVYYGVGGIGKTRLRKELCRRLDDTRPEVGWAVLDFATSSHRDVENALSWLSQELTRKYGFRSPSFELALVQYLRKSRPNSPIRKEEFPFLEESDMLAEAISAARDVPGLEVGAKITRLALRTHGWLAEWWTKRGQRQLYELQGMEPNEIAERLPMFWADDLRYFMQRKGRPVVLFIDSYEALWEEGRAEGRFFVRDEWVRELVAHLPEVPWIIAGREKLRWGELPDDWKGCLEQHLVGQLDNSDARRFLVSCGIVEEEIQRAIVKGSEGVPFYLDLAADTYLEIRRGQRKKPTPSDFGNTQPKLVERFLRHLDRYETETLKVLSVPRFFDRDLFERLIERFSTGYPATAFSELCRFSFVQEGQVPGTYTIHPLMRRGLEEHQDPGLREQVHRYLFDRYDAALRGLDSRSIEDSDKTGFAEAFYHGRHTLAAHEFVGWFTARAQAFEQAGLWLFLTPLREELVHLAEDLLGPEHPKTAASMNDLALLYRHHGLLREAEPLHERALAVREEVLGHEHPDTAASLDDLAFLYYYLGRWREAESLLERALETREQALGPEHPDTALSLNDLAVLYTDRGSYEEAESLLKRALMIREKVLGPEHPDTAETLYNLAPLYQRQGRYAEAESVIERAVKIEAKTLGPEHPWTASSMTELAVVYQDQGRYEEAESLIDKALAILEKKLGLESHWTNNALYRLGVIYRDQGRYAEAEPLLERALETREKMVGSEHPKVADIVNYLALLYHDQGRYAEAESLHKRALRIRKEKLGPEHPDTTLILYDLAKLRCQQERYEEAELLFERALRVQEKALGTGHPDTTRTRRALEDLLKKMRTEIT
jgi:tetratricopeptide (TPR) repeat protein